MTLTRHYLQIGRLELAWHDPWAGWGLSAMWLTADRCQGRALFEVGFRRTTR